MSDNSKMHFALSTQEKRALLAELLRKKQDRPKAFAVSFAQQRLWFLDQLEPNNPSYNIVSAVRLTGQLEVTALQQSVNEIVRRHEILRTTFTLANGVPTQVIHSELTPEIPLIDLSEWPAAALESEVHRLVKEEKDRAFDLAHGPLLRISVLRLDEHEHVVLLAMHHIISDGWSMGVLVRELTTLYSAFSDGAPSPLPPLAIQYVDFAQWQREWLTAEMIERQLEYWKQQLAATPLLQLPTDRPRPAIRTHQGAAYSFSFSKPLAASIAALSQRENVTLFMTLLAAFNTLLHRYTDQTDVVVGTPIAGRNRKETEALIGFFVNTLVLRTDLTGDPTFRELLARVRETSLAAYANQDLPFEMLVEKLQPERSLSHTPLFQVMFVLQNTSEPEVKLPRVSINGISVESSIAKFDLTLAIEQRGDRLRGSFEYSTDLYDAVTIKRMAGQFQSLLEGIIRNPDQRLSGLPLMTEVERRQLLSETSAQTREFASEKCLPELFVEYVIRTPDAIALVYEAEQLTYAELNTRANQLARHLQSLGVGPDVVVGVCLERSIEMIVALLGILKAGGAYLPLDPAYPRDRLAFMLKDAAVSVLLTQAGLMDSLPQYEGRLVCLDTDWEVISMESTENPTITVLPDNLAYVIYTSGSTGKPKGVMVSHGNVTRLFAATEERFQFDERDVWTLFHSYAFDFSVWEMWGALLYGGRLVIVPYLVSRTPEAFYEMLQAEQVTVLNQTPSAFRQLSRVAERGVGKERLALRVVIFGGEALEFGSLQSWVREKGAEQPQLINMYGITETTVHVTYRRVGAAEVEAGAGSLIGRGISDLEVYVLDRQLQVTPVGVAGEMYVGGAGVARGYLGRAETTAERFVPHPYSRQPGARLYRTGDAARYLADGDLEYLGRLDQQVKIRGYRIELGEIEAVLIDHPDVVEAVVVAREDRTGRKSLTAYVVGKPGALPSLAVFRSFAKEKLPDYMIPEAFVLMDALPLTTNGKINRKALPEPTSSGMEKIYVAPRTAIEKTLAIAWARTLGTEQVGIHDNFFELGGDSIRSIQLRAKAQQLGLEFSIQQLFQHQTIHELALAIEQTEATPSPIPKTAPFSLVSEAERRQLPEDVEDAYPLAMLQAGMLFHSDYNPADNLYHNISSAHIKSSFDVDRLQAALGQLVGRHPVLRTSFHLSGFNEPMQLVHRTVDVPLVIEDLSHLTAREQEDVIAADIEAEKGRKFDWTHAPLLRFRVHVRSNETFQITWTEHHAILDGWSVASMLTELFQLYFTQIDDRATLAPSDSVTFRDFVALERQALASEDAQRYWNEKLRDSVATVLPRWPVAGKRAGTGRGSVVTAIPDEVCEGLKRLVKTTGIPLKSMLLAAHMRVMSLLSGQPDVVTGVVVNGRPEEEGGERVLGLFLNTLPFRLTLNHGTWSDLARATFETEREMMPFRRYPMAQLQHMRNNEPLFETAFNYVHFHVYETLQTSRYAEVLEETSFAETNFTLGASFSLSLSPERILLALDYETSEFDKEQVEAISTYYIRALTAMAQRPADRYDSVSLLSKHERQQLESWNKRANEYESKHCLHELFSAQAKRTPENVALVFDNQRLTYRQLEERANQLAHYLRRLGVGPDVLVGILMERSVEMVVALLGVLKAGGAYVPLNLEHPRERVAWMLEDASVAVLLTEGRYAEGLAEQSAAIVCLDSDKDAIEQESLDQPEVAAAADNLAYVIYTSGSTGKPKGVMVSHGNVTRLFAATEERFQFDERDVWTLFHSYAFDFSVWEMWGALLYGGRLVIVPYLVSRTPEAFYEMLQAEQVTVLNQTPSAFRQLSRVAERGVGKERLALRVVIFGGEALEFGSLQSWVREKGAEQPQLINMYGITETTVHVTYRRVGAAEVEAGAGSLIGRGISDLEVYVLDRQLQVTPVGVAGEMYVGGAGVARGYLGRAETTAERFVPHPYSRQPGARLYRTGDAARYLADGDLEYLGRLDQQVKIRGYRIELGEIEAVLTQLPSVRDVAVVAREEAAGEKRLVAYLVAEDEAPASIGELRRLLHDRLPDYMIPASFVFLDKLPLTANGKLDRRALPAPEFIRSQMEVPFIIPRDSIELKLLQIFEDVLDIRPISIMDNFFQIGGHSLLALRLMARIEDLFGEKLALATLFQRATIEQLATLLRQRRKEVQRSSLVKIQPKGNRLPFFCVHPAGGNILCYLDLARHLDSDQPFYGFQAQGLDEERVPYSDVKTMATHYLEELLATQLDGPYLLGGYSMGGVVAFEMAQQLRARGKTVGLLALFDTKAPNPDQKFEADEKVRLMVSFARELGLSLERLALSRDYLLSLEPDQQLIYVVEEAKQQSMIPADIGHHQIRRLWRVFETNVWAMRNYVPQIYDGKIALFNAMDNPAHGPQNTGNGWKVLATGGIDTQELPGDHFSIVREPHVRSLAQRLTDCISMIEQ